MRFNDLVSGTALIALGLVCAWLARSFPTGAGAAYGPSFLPTLLGIGLMFCGGGLIAGHVLSGAKARWLERPAWSRSLYHLAGIPLVVGLSVGYVLLSDRLGFVTTMFGLLVTAMLWFKVKPTMAVLVQCSILFGA